MNNYSGKLIVIDGTDGSGKTTQLNLLKNKLEAEGYEIMVADFPQYNQKSAGLVEEYLSGKYGQANEVTPYQASIFYAVDRYLIIPIDLKLGSELAKILHEVIGE